MPDTFLQSVHSFPTDSDPRLDWISKHDSRSLDYTVGAQLALADSEIVPKHWKAGPTLDQAQEGACVGFGWTQELMSSPHPFYPDVEVGNYYAREYYHECLVNDEYPGEADTGTSVLAGAQTAVRRDLMDEYWWCTSIEEMRDAVITLGPVVIGIPWYSYMYQPPLSGLINVGGDLVGGHCILVDEYHPDKRLNHEDYNSRFEVFGVHNSWGPDWGNNGRGYLRFEDMRDLVKNYGEMCVPVGRQKVRF